MFTQLFVEWKKFYVYSTRALVNSWWLPEVRNKKRLMKLRENKNRKTKFLP
jgi:hypothetical protein